MVRMLRCGLAVATVLVSSACALSAPVPGGGAPAVPALIVDTLRIIENGAASPGLEGGECGAFVLEEDAVRRVLEAGAAISRDQYMHELPWSPCLVRGRVVLADGRQGTWTIRQYGTASVLLDDGDELFLWCRTCTRPPFVPVE